MKAALEEIVLYINDVFGDLRINDLIDVILISFVIYQMIQLMRRTRASQVVKGLGIIIVAAWLVDILELQVLGEIFKAVVNNVAVVLVVLFQPELRRVLEQIGRKTAIDRTASDKADDEHLIVEGIVSAMLRLSKRKVGALIVIERRTGVHDVIQTGTAIDSLITSELLENIFEPNTPLHDGAVIIRGSRIVAAGCVLPLTDDNMLSKELGTRHRAGLGMTETTDAVSLIVSEETGTISMARSGRLTRHLDGESLRRILGEVFYKEREDSILWPLISRRRNKG